eukprot:CAMPEP_0181131564 /NCGR_PEP_ID=MMETSP1071-20121207/30492_1 /TAXON_ID=35127 /ORGANISM="Thalassiosira sp., Strain NH16" /LENGTH=44 /DNA_ID= /DNA_START= /DNA_END= /DNA_ORIENTATION=
MSSTNIPNKKANNADLQSELLALLDDHGHATMMSSVRDVVTCSH